MDRVNKTRSIAVDSNNKLVFPQISKLIEANPELGGGDLPEEFNVNSETGDIRIGKLFEGEPITNSIRISSVETLNLECSNSVNIPNGLTVDSNINCRMGGTISTEYLNATNITTNNITNNNYDPLVIQSGNSISLISSVAEIGTRLEFKIDAESNYIGLSTAFTNITLNDDSSVIDSGNGILTLHSESSLILNSYEIDVNAYQGLNLHANGLVNITSDSDITFNNVYGDLAIKSQRIVLKSCIEENGKTTKFIMDAEENYIDLSTTHTNITLNNDSSVIDSGDGILTLHSGSNIYINGPTVFNDIVSFTGNDNTKELNINYDSGISMKLTDNGEDALNNEVLINNSTGITIAPSLAAQLKHKVGNVHIDGSSISINPAGNSDDWGIGKNYPELFECGHQLKMTNTGIDLYDEYNNLVVTIGAGGIIGNKNNWTNFSFTGNDIYLKATDFGSDSGYTTSLSAFGINSKVNGTTIGACTDYYHVPSNILLYYARTGIYELNGILTSKNIYKTTDDTVAKPTETDYTEVLLDKLTTKIVGEKFNPETEEYEYTYATGDTTNFDKTAVGLDYFYNVIKELNARIKELESASGSSTDPVDQIKLKINGTNEYCIVKANKDANGAITLSLE